MRDRLHNAGRWAIKFIESPIVIVVTFIISLTSFGIALNANVKATSEANNRAKASQAQADHLRATFCDLIQPLAIVPPSNSTTPLGLQIRLQSAKTAAELQCSPDPYDHK